MRRGGSRQTSQSFLDTGKARKHLREDRGTIAINIAELPELLREP
jgi:hypothetical protein